MPRRNNRKTYATGKSAVFSADHAENAGVKPVCVGCAFAGFGGVCKTSEGLCLKTVKDTPERRAADNAGHNR